MRALCLFASERIEGLQAEGHPIEAGAIGENVTIRGLEWDDVVPGVMLKLGDGVLIEITSYTVPCATIMHCFLEEDPTRVSQAAYPGWSRVYARVRASGTIRVGDQVELAVRVEEPAAPGHRA